MPAISPARDVGVQSWSFREFKTPEALCAKVETAVRRCPRQALALKD